MAVKEKSQFWCYSNAVQCFPLVYTIRGDGGGVVVSPLVLSVQWCVHRPIRTRVGAELLELLFFFLYQTY